MFARRRPQTLSVVAATLAVAALMPGSFGMSGFGTPASRSHFIETPTQAAHWAIAPAARMRATRLTDGVRGLAAELKTPRANKASVSHRLISLSRARQQALVRLLVRDPSAVRPMILAAGARRVLSGVHGAQVETKVQLHGRYRIWHHDDFRNERNDTYLDQLVTSKGKVFTLHGGTSGLSASLTFARLKPNARMAIRGYLLGGHVLVTKMRTDGRGLASAAATVGPINTAVIVANFSDSTTPVDMNAIKTVFQGNPGADVASYFNEASYGKMQIVPSFFGSYTINAPTGTECNGSTLNADVMNAANADVDFTKFRRLIFVVNCPNLGGYAGSEGVVSTPDGTVTAAVIDLEPSLARTLSIDVHELSHTLGSFNKHASFFLCQPDAFDPPSRFGPNCTSVEYGDEFDALGSEPGGQGPTQLDPFHKANAGWFDSSQFPTVTTSGTYTLSPYEQASPTGQPLALNIPRGSTGTTFTVEYRQPTGFDSWLNSSTACPRCTVTQGASIRLSNYATSGSGGGSDTQLIDTTPGSVSSSSYYPIEDGYDGALLPGKTFTDPDYGISITTVSAGTSGLTVQVTIPPQACTHAAPSVSGITPTSQTATAGQTKTYTLTVTNKDSAGCPAQTFRYLSSTGQEITSVATPDFFSLAPGASTTVSLAVTSSPWTIDGSYSYPSGAGQIIGNSLDAGGTGVPLTYVVSSPSDTAAPTAPTGLTGKMLGSTVVKLAWTASTDNLGVAGYQIVTNTGSLYTTQATSFLNVQLSPGTTTTYSVRAYDHKNNLSPAAQVTVTTPGSTDYTAPSAPVVSGTATDHSITLSWSPSTDNGTVAYYGVRPCLVPNCIVPADTTSFTVSGLPTRTRYDIQIFAYDGDGNYSAPGGGKITVYTAAAGMVAPGQPRQFYSPLAVRGRVDLAWAPSSGAVQYQVYRNSIMIGSTTSTSYSDTKYGSGTYSIQAVDSVGSLSPLSAACAFGAGYTAGSTDTTAPAASITNPSSGATVSGTVTVTASASDNVGLAEVDFYVDGTMVAQSRSAPYSFSWNTTTVPTGSHWLYARAVDTSGNYGTASLTLVTVGSGGGTPTPPTVAIAAPTSGSTVSGITGVDTTASAGAGVAKVELLVDGTLKATDTSAPYTFAWDSQTVTDGAHQIAAKAIDTTGSSAMDAVTVNTANADATPPSAPSGLTAASGGTTAINLTWNASTDNVGVTGYDVYRDGAKVASVTTTSYGDTGLTPATGYTYWVVARDTVGNASDASTSVDATTASLDAQTPTKPGNPRAAVAGTTQIALGWATSTDNVGVVAYEIYRDSARIAESSVTHYLDSGLAPGSSHTYYVVARDAAGNHSLASSTLSTHTGSTSTATTGTIAGVVYNQNGKALSNAIVKVTVNGTLKSAKTSSSGVFKLTSLPAGTYTLTITLSGYQTASVTATAVSGQTVLLVSPLSPG